MWYNKFCYRQIDIHVLLSFHVSRWYALQISYALLICCYYSHLIPQDVLVGPITEAMSFAILVILFNLFKWVCLKNYLLKLIGVVFCLGFAHDIAMSRSNIAKFIAVGRRCDYRFDRIFYWSVYFLLAHRPDPLIIFFQTKYVENKYTLLKYLRSA